MSGSPASEESILYRMLDHPWIFRLSQLVLAPGSAAACRRLERELQLDSAAGRILNVGAGPEGAFASGSGLQIGLDLEPAYAAEFSSGSRKGVAGRAERLPFRDGVFDEVRCFGLFHHMEDAAVRDSIREMLRVSSPTARFVLADGVLPRRWYTRPLAELIDRMDRGTHFRNEERLRAVVEDALGRNCPGRRVTHAWTGLELYVFDPIRRSQLASGTR